MPDQGKSSIPNATGGSPDRNTPTNASVDDKIKELNACIERNRRCAQDELNALSDAVEMGNKQNAAQFQNINSALENIMDIIKCVQETNKINNKTGPHHDDNQQSHSNLANVGNLAAQLQNNTHAADDVQHIQPAAARTLHDLPIFFGEPVEWPKFYAMYVQSTAAYGYTSLDNCIRLQKCLKGEAKEAVDYLLLDMNKTADVIEALEFRFGRPELLAQAQLRSVREIPSIPETRPELIVPFASKVANMVAYLNQPKTKQYLANPELLAQLIQKLPLSRRHSWAEHAIDIEPFASIIDFSCWLKNVARCVSYMAPAATLSASSQEPVTNKHRPSDSQQPPNRRGRILHANTDKPKCIICGLGCHEVSNCRKFLQWSVEERWDEIRAKRLCFSCLATGHDTAHCENRSRCNTDGCVRPHHKLLHSRRNPFQQPEQSAPPVAKRSTDNNVDGRILDRVHHNNSEVDDSRILFRILPVNLFGPNKVVQTFALLDEGSAVTMIDEEVAKELELHGPQTTLELQWFGNRCASELSMTVELGISGTSRDHQQFEMANVRTVRQLQLPTQSVKMSELANRFQPIRGLPIQDYQHAVPKILIGLDNIHLGVPTRQISCSAPGPVATKTRLGWVVYGPSKPAQTTNTTTVLHHQMATTTLNLDELHNTVQNFFSLESFGVRYPDQPLESRDDKRARSILEQSTTRIGERFETGLLWKSDVVRFPDSKTMATNRLLSVERKMKRDSLYAAQYNSIIDGYISKGYARRLSSKDAATTGDKTWYLPHFAVTNPNKPGKMRIVFDAAAVVNGESLNSALLKGPDLNRSLLAVLYKFRMGAIGVCADIKEMFLQVRIRKEDTDSQRFLWRNGDTSRPIDVYVMQAMIFGSACSPCSAQFVKNSNADEYRDRFPEAVKAIKENHYVDDFVASFDEPNEAIRVTNAVVDIHSKGGFELRGFLCNDKNVLNSIGGNEANQTSVNMQLGESKSEKILGMYWDNIHDNFLFQLTFSRVDPAVISGEKRPTKRELLSATMSVFDPFGFLANFTIYAKLLLQEIWKHGIGWDDEIPKEVNSKWLQWVSKLDRCREIRIPRCYFPYIQTKRVQLHIFADASQSALATVAYWRIEASPNEWYIVFVAGKSRCAPPKLISIPRLELEAAVLAVRLKKSILSLHEVDLDRIIFWTDSKTVTQWVRSDHLHFKPFVAHRIAEIHNDSAISQWHWLPTQHNAADDATRAKYPVRYMADNRWLRGPDFLAQAESSWPVEPAQMLCEEGTEEVRPHSVHLACRSMAFLLRFVNNARTKTKICGELLPAEIERAELHLVRAVQAEAFSNELAMLKQGKPIDRGSKIRALMPHIDRNGVLRMTGRADKATHLPEDARNPIILPKEQHLTHILVATYHRRMRHQQEATIISEIRLRYWVPHLRVLVRRIKAKCMLCRLRSAHAIEQVMGQLPIDRLTPFVRPFTYTGMDYFGPLYVTIGRRREKRWVCLFTCMTIRAIHLELATDLSADACIICIRNFMNIRGVPMKIRSDNGTNFIGASRELREAIDLLDHASIQRELSVRKVEWQFNCPSNPEAGGCWERLVQSVKRILNVTVKEEAPQVETLRSLLIEAANIINSRPLTHLPVLADEDEPLTPNHFILGSASSTQTPGPDDQRKICLRKQWRISQALKNRFWKRWVLEYLPDLTRRAKGYDEIPALQIGSLVFICDTNLPRGEWRRGRVKEVYPGPDGRIRTALIATADGDLKRPVTKLAILNVKE